MTISPLHAKVVNKLRKLIERNLPEEFILRQESPFLEGGFLLSEIKICVE
jgi:hypothetical protein